MATINDVARAAGVSKSTVSIVLNGQSAQRKIPLATQQRVLEAVRTVDYQPNLFARNLRTATDRYTIALYWAVETGATILARVLEGVQRTLMEGPDRINLVFAPYPRGHLAREEALDTLPIYNGAVIATVEADELAGLESSPPMTPLVVMDRHSDVFSSVTADNEAAGQLAARALLGQGIGDIGMLVLEHPYVAVYQRRNSFVKACSEQGVTSFLQKTYWTAGTVEGGFEAGRRLLAGGTLPQAIYCDDDAAALGLAGALTRAGVRVPQDIRLVTMGTGPRDLLRYGAPSMAVVQVPVEQMIIQSVQLLVAQLRHQVTEPRHIVLPVELTDFCAPEQ